MRIGVTLVSGSTRRCGGNFINTWLFTWNPEKWAWDSRLNGYAETKHEIETIGCSYIKWSCGVNKSIRTGDRIFLFRLGKDPRGIVASGYALSDVFEGAHWDEGKAVHGKRVRRVWIKLDKMVETNFKDILSSERLLELSPEFCWSPQASGIGINEDLAKAVEREWRN